MDISIVIINHNTKKLTKNCINSIINTTHHHSYEIILIDNSTDKSQQIRTAMPYTKIYFTENNGFSHGCNMGAEKSSGKYLLMLNSDTIVHNNCIDNCIDYLENNPQYSALGCKILLPDNTLDKACKRGFPTPLSSICYMTGIDRLFPKNRVIGKYHTTYLSENKTSSIEVISGAFILIEKTTFEKTGGFDESFFMYGEDIDLCYRLNQSNHRIVYFPKASITHYKGSSGLKNKSDFIIKQFYKSMLIFYNKNYKTKYNFLINFIINLSIYTKMTLSRISGYFFRKDSYDRNTSRNS